ncbi:hypothetical protein J27TS7_42030 [Paenibacillus dendritiformis]|nr:hypothetical protein J27TS7_42030 [Paenibacillus dendritiformis]
MKVITFTNKQEFLCYHEDVVHSTVTLQTNTTREDKGFKRDEEDEKSGTNDACPVYGRDAGGMREREQRWQGGQ